jgi:ABC-type branched-subunit amino acid transport system substrate-binding protein
MVEILEFKEVDAVVVVQRGDSWADGIHEKFQSLYEQGGGKVLERIRYPAEATMFEKYLEPAENALAEAVDEYGWENVAVQLLSFDEAALILQEARGYTTLYNVTWYGSDSTDLSRRIKDDAPEESAHLVLYGLSPILLENEETDALIKRFQEATNTSCDFYTATSYDIAMILAKSVIEVGGDDVEAVKKAFREISHDYVGITGLCRLDEADDRYACNYAIHGYAEINNEVGSYQFGLVTDTNEIIWFEELRGT